MNYQKPTNQFRERRRKLLYSLSERTEVTVQILASVCDLCCKHFVVFFILDDIKFNQMFKTRPSKWMYSVTLLGCEFTNSVYNNYFIIIFMYLEILVQCLGYQINYFERLQST